MQEKVADGGIGVEECGLTLEHPLLCSLFPARSKGGKKALFFAAELTFAG